MIDFPPIYDFEDTVREMPVSKFDVQDVRGWHVAAGPSPIQIIRDAYPRIYDQITFLWGTQELQDLFSHWLYLDQHGRLGWPMNIAAALLDLSMEHSGAFGLEPRAKTKGRDSW